MRSAAYPDTRDSTAGRSRPCSRPEAHCLVDPAREEPWLKGVSAGAHHAVGVPCQHGLHVPVRHIHYRHRPCSPGHPGRLITTAAPPPMPGCASTATKPPPHRAAALAEGLLCRKPAGEEWGEEGVWREDAGLWSLRRRASCATRRETRGARDRASSDHGATSPHVSCSPGRGGRAAPSKEAVMSQRVSEE